MDVTERDLSFRKLGRFYAQKTWVLLLCIVLGAAASYAVQVLSAGSSDEQFASTRQFTFAMVHDTGLPYEEEVQVYPEQKSVIGSALQSKVADSSFLKSEEGTVSVEYSADNGLYSLTASAASAEKASNLADDALSRIEEYLGTFEDYGTVKVYIGASNDGVPIQGGHVKFALLGGMAFGVLAAIVLFILFASRRSVDDAEDAAYYAQSDCLATLSETALRVDEAQKLIARLRMIESNGSRSYLFVGDAAAPAAVKGLLKELSNVKMNAICVRVVKSDGEDAVSRSDDCEEVYSTARVFGNKALEDFLDSKESAVVLVVAEANDAEAAWLAKAADSTILTVAQGSDGGRLREKSCFLKKEGVCVAGVVIVSE